MRIFYSDGRAEGKGDLDVSLFPIPYDSRRDERELTTTENSGKSVPGCLIGYQKHDNSQNDIYI
jgi:hypothetical protein